MVYYSCPALGANSPASLAGTLVLGNADWLAGLTIQQLKRPGAPMCTHGFTVQLMDMRTTLWSYSAPEAQLAYGMISDMAHWYGLPAWGLEAQTDTAYLDPQAGVELSATTGWATLTGFEMVHNTGNIGAGKLISAEAMVLADEVVGYCKAFARPQPMSVEVIQQGAALIDQVGPLGEYVSHPHTLDHFRDFWYPRVFSRSNFDPLAISENSGLHKRILAKALELIGTHTPEPLDEARLEELAKLEAGWMARQ